MTTTYNRFAIAIQIQNACNPIAITNELVRVMEDIKNSPNYRGMPSITNDPAYVLIVDKLHDMTGRPSNTVSGDGSYSRCYGACMTLAENPDTPRHTLGW